MNSCHNLNETCFTSGPNEEEGDGDLFKDIYGLILLHLFQLLLFHNDQLAKFNKLMSTDDRPPRLFLSPPLKLESKVELNMRSYILVLRISEKM